MRDLAPDIKKFEKNVPMRPYLEFGLEHISHEEVPEDVTELLVNRYFASGYTAADALTGYIYCISVVSMIYGNGWIWYLMQLKPWRNAWKQWAGL